MDQQKEKTELDKKIEKFDEKAISLVFTIFFSVMTSVAMTLLMLKAIGI